jgi:hypothetical protein
MFLTVRAVRGDFAIWAAAGRTLRAAIGTNRPPTRGTGNKTFVADLPATTVCTHPRSCVQVVQFQLQR